jgi:hypothetical protein
LILNINIFVNGVFEHLFFFHGGSHGQSSFIISLYFSTELEPVLSQNCRTVSWMTSIIKIFPYSFYQELLTF